MNCKECGYEMTEDMNFCPKCGSKREAEPEKQCGMHTEFERLFGVLRETGERIGQEIAKQAAESEEAETVADENLETVEKLCAELLAWAKEWMEEHPNDSVYSEYARGLLEEMNAEDDMPYICCDVLDNREEGYAITDGGFYFLESGVFSSTDYAYSFDELGEAKIKYDNGLIYIDDDCVNIGLSDEEAKKLYKVLKTISRMYEPEDDVD